MRIIPCLIAAASVLLILAPACSKKKSEEVPPPAAEQAVPDSANANPNAENSKPEANPQPAEQPKPAIIQEPQAIKHRTPLPFAPVEIETLKGMTPEDAEASLLKPFSANAPEQTAELQALIEKAELGDDRAKEQFANQILKRPATDPNYSRAMKYLKSIREFKDPDALTQRGILEFTNTIENPNAKVDAQKYLKQAGDMNHERALEFLLKNAAFGLQDYALDKLEKIYESRIAANDPKAKYEWARLLEFAPSSYAPKAEKLIEESANAGYLPARFTRAVTLMHSQDTWNQGFELMKESAANGSEDANLNLATLYAVIQYSDDRSQASEVFGTEITEAQYEMLRGILDKYAAETSQDPKMLIADLAHKAGGFDEACGILLGIGSTEDNEPGTVKARDYVVECTERFIQANPSRDACDHAFDQVTYAGEESFDMTQYYTPEQRTKLGELMITCYRLALEDGQDYPQDAQYLRPSTATQLAIPYSGIPVLNIAPDKAREISYLLYAADHGDIIGQVILANEVYNNKDSALHHPPRACFWYQRAAASHICKNYCGTPDTENDGVCNACKDAQKAVDNCKAAIAAK